MEQGEGFGFAQRNSFRGGWAVCGDSTEMSSPLDVGAGRSKVLKSSRDPPTLKPWEGAAEHSRGTGAHPWMPCTAPGQRNIGMLFLAPPWHFLEVTVTFESQFLNLIIISCAGNWRPLINPGAWNGPGIQPQILAFLQHPLAEAL